MQADQSTRDAIGSNHRPARCETIRAAIADPHHIVRQERGDAAGLPRRKRGQEVLEHLPVFGAWRNGHAAFTFQATLRPVEDLPARRGRLAEVLPDLLIRKAETFPEHVHHPLFRPEPLEQRQKGARHLLALLGALLGIRDCGRGQDGLRQPRADVLLSLHARRFQEIEREAGDDRGEVGAQ